STRVVFFSTHPSPPAFYTLSLHDALPISVTSRTATWTVRLSRPVHASRAGKRIGRAKPRPPATFPGINDSAKAAFRCSVVVWSRSEEHTSELQSRENLGCRLLLEKKKQNK